jgi:5,10-methylenetetrahydromethanopterin reductase
MIVGTAAHPFRPFEEWLKVARLVEELGYGMTCQSQNPLLRGDPFVELGVAARETQSVLLATTVAVAGLVNPAVQAAAIATVDEISHGRAVLGLGRGAATAKAIGESALNSGGLEAYVLALRDLLGGRAVAWRGVELRLPWVIRPVPVILSAYGPRTLQLAGRCADGVLIASAVGGPVLADAIRSVRESAAAAGRAPGDVTIWVTARAAVGTDRDEALADLKAILAGSGRQLDPDEPDLPEDHRLAVAELKARYVEADHVVPGGANELLIEQLGLVDYLAGRFAVTGTADECRAQFQAMADLGVDCVFLNGAMRNEERMIVAMAEQVGVRYVGRDPAASATG